MTEQGDNIGHIIVDESNKSTRLVYELFMEVYKSRLGAESKEISDESVDPKIEKINTIFDKIVALEISPFAKCDGIKQEDPVFREDLTGRLGCYSIIPTFTDYRLETLLYLSNVALVLEDNLKLFDRVTSFVGNYVPGKWSNGLKEALEIFCHMSHNSGAWWPSEYNKSTEELFIDFLTPAEQYGEKAQQEFVFRMNLLPHVSNPAIYQKGFYALNQGKVHEIALAASGDEQAEYLKMFGTIAGKTKGDAVVVTKIAEAGESWEKGMKHFVTIAYDITSALSYVPDPCFIPPKNPSEIAEQLNKLVGLTLDGKIGDVDALKKRSLEEKKNYREPTPCWG